MSLESMREFLNVAAQNYPCKYQIGIGNSIEKK